MPDEENIEVDLRGPGGTGVSARGKRIAEVISILSLSGLIFLGYVLIEHDRSTARAIENNTSALKELALANRLTGCLIWMSRSSPSSSYAAARAECEQLVR